MRKWLILLAILLALGGGGWLFWSLGSLPRAPAGKAVLGVDRGNVELKRATGDSWALAKNGDELQVGDSIRTNADGQATLTFFDLTQSRLGPGTEIRISELQAPSPSSSLLIRLDLQAGRLWSHILRLFELDDTFAVTAQNTVATVRGTTFDFDRRADGMSVAVTESAVELSGVAAPENGQKQPIIVGEGFMVSLDGKGGLGQTVSLPDSVKENDWFDGNGHRDGAFAEESGRRLVERLDRMGGTSPDSLFDYVTRLSERMHLSLGKDRAPELYAGYVERRLYGAKKLIERGRSGAAFAALSQLENEVNAKISGQDGAAYRRPLNRAFSEITRLFSDVGPTSPLYRMKQRLEDVQVSFAGGDQVEQAYARLRAIDARLDEASMLITQSSLDEAKVALEAARQGLANVERDIDRLPDSVAAERLSALRGKLNVLKAREAAYRVRLATAIEPPQSETMPLAGAVTSTTSTVDSVIPTSTAATATTPYENIMLSAAPGSTTVGQTVSIKVRALKADGQSVEVTALSRFTATGPAKMNGPLLTPTGVGQVAVTARFEDLGQPFEAQIKIDVKPAPVTLQTLRVEPAEPLNVTFGQRVPLKVVAVYSDGSTKDVTASAKFSTSNLILGYMAGNIFNAGQETTGVVRISAVYEEGTKRITAFRDFNVTGR